MRTKLSSNPYSGVSWFTVHNVRANLHTHTTNSDGAAHPHEAIDNYKTRGHGALSITDHNRISYNWQFATSPLWDVRRQGAWEDRDPVVLGMIDVVGNEVNGQHHMNLFWKKDYVDRPDVPEEESWQHKVTPALELTHQDEGTPRACIYFAHPGRYWKVDQAYQPEDEFSPQWYKTWFETYPMDTLMGLEVFNDDNRYPNDRILWDLLLADLMPSRPLWAFGADDYHGSGLYRTHWSCTNHFLVNPMSHQQLRDSMVGGWFTASYTSSGSTIAPQLLRVFINEKDKVITLEHEAAYARWISGIEIVDGIPESRIIHQGNSFSYKGFDEPYVRAELVNSETNITILQPFGFEQTPGEEYWDEEPSEITQTTRSLEARPEWKVTPRLVPM